MVTVFAEFGDLFKPRRFAGHFGAAPSVALATLGLTIASQGKNFAELERARCSRAPPFLGNACAVSWILMRFKCSAMLTAVFALPLWFTAALAVWLIWFR